MLGLVTSPFVAFNPDKDLEGSTLASYICSCLCATFTVMQLMKSPIKPFMIIGLCAFISCFSTVALSKDTYDRFTRKSK